jgi:hypothetical protein
LTAVDDHGVADDEGGCVRTEPQDGGGDFAGLPIHPIGSCAITRSRPSAVPPVNRCIISVSTIPGHTALMRMFDDA